jgi:hypothetical protein
MSIAGLYNPTIEQGATFSRTIYWRDENSQLVDLTSYTARAKFKTSHGASSSILELTTENSGITLGGAAGTITLTATATATAALSAPGHGVWDLELVDGSGVVTRLLEGRYSVTAEVTS